MAERPISHQPVRGGQLLENADDVAASGPAEAEVRYHQRQPDAERCQQIDHKERCTAVLANQ